jgi:nicotinamidase-related amidase
MMHPATSSQPRERVLVCLDLQQENLAADVCADQRRVLRNCGRVLDHARRSRWRVVHVLRRGSDRGVSRPPAGLEPRPTEPVMFRKGISAFSNVDFDRLIRRLERPELVLIGFSLSSSYLATALIGFDADLTVTLVEDASGATPLDPLDRAEVEMVSRRIARPFVNLITTDRLTGERGGLRLVHSVEAEGDADEGT